MSNLVGYIKSGIFQWPTNYRAAKARAARRGEGPCFWCACISIKRIHKKASGRMSESGFFLSQLHRILVGIREFQAKSGYSRRDSPLACPLFHCFGTQYGGRDVTWKRPMHLDTWWHHLATLLDLMMISHYILYISMYAVLIVLLFCDVTT